MRARQERWHIPAGAEMPLVCCLGNSSVVLKRVGPSLGMQGALQKIEQTNTGQTNSFGDIYEATEDSDWITMERLRGAEYRCPVAREHWKQDLSD